MDEPQMIVRRKGQKEIGRFERVLAQLTDRITRLTCLRGTEGYARI